MNHKPQGTCPVCNGTLRQTPPESEMSYVAQLNRSYDKETNTIACRNCMPKGMFASYEPTGVVSLNKDGQPCTHEFNERKIGRCYYSYTCKHCGDSYSIDSGD